VRAVREDVGQPPLDAEHARRLLWTALYVNDVRSAEQLLTPALRTVLHRTRRARWSPAW